MKKFAAALLILLVLAVSLPAMALVNIEYAINGEKWRTYIDFGTDYVVGNFPAEKAVRLVLTNVTADDRPLEFSYNYLITDKDGNVISPAATPYTLPAGAKADVYVQPGRDYLMPAQDLLTIYDKGINGTRIQIDVSNTGKAIARRAYFYFPAEETITLYEGEESEEIAVTFGYSGNLARDVQVSVSDNLMLTSASTLSFEGNMNEYTQQPAEPEQTRTVTFKVREGLAPGVYDGILKFTYYHAGHDMPSTKYVYMVLKVNPKFEFSTSEIDFGDYPINTPNGGKMQWISVTNNTEEAQRLTIPTDSNFKLSDTSSIEMPSGAVASVFVHPINPVLGPVSSTVSIGGHPVTLRYNGVYPLSLENTAEEIAVKEGETFNEPVATLKNISDYPVAFAISTESNADPDKVYFYQPDGLVSLPAGGEAPLNLRIVGAAEGDYTALPKVTMDCGTLKGEPIDINILDPGDVTLSVSQLSWGDLNINDLPDLKKAVIVTNTTRKDVPISLVAENFALSTQGGVTSVPSGGTATVYIEPAIIQMGLQSVSGKLCGLDLPLEYTGYYKPTSASGDYLSMTPAEVDFGVITKNSPAVPLTLKVKNVHAQETVPLSASISADYTLSLTGEKLLLPGEEIEIQVTPVNTQVGNHDATLILADGLSTYSVPVRFTVEGILTVTPSSQDFGLVDFTNVDTLSLDVEVNNATLRDVTIQLLGDSAMDCVVEGSGNYQLPAGQKRMVKLYATRSNLPTGQHTITDSLCGVEVSFTYNGYYSHDPQVTLSTNTLSFGTILEGGTIPQGQQIIITNNDPVERQLTVDQVPAGFTTDAASVTVPANGSVALTVTPVTNALGSYTGWLRLSVDNQSLNAYLDYTVEEVPFTGEIIITPASLDLGLVDLSKGEATHGQIVVKNGTNKPRDITAFSSIHDVTWEDDDDILLPGEEVTITLSLPPANAQAGVQSHLIYLLNQSVEVTYRGYDSTQYNLSVDVDRVNFPTIKEEESLPAAQKVTVTNNDPVPRTVTPILEGGRFICSETAAFEVPANSSYEVDVWPVVQTPGNYLDELVFAWGNNGSSTVTLFFNVLTASGEEILSISVTPAALDFGSIGEGHPLPAAQAVTVANTGSNETAFTCQLSNEKFTVTPAGSQTLPLGGSCTLMVQPKALNVGVHSAVLTVYDAAGNAHEVALSHTVTEASSSGSAGQPAIPQTGDAANPALWAGLMAAAALAMPRRKRK